MAPPESGRAIIVNADDFGRSSSINQSVIEAHQNGILTTASLMVNESSAAEAVTFAGQNPRLGVGLHLALVMGKSALSRDKIPGLINHQDGGLSNAPVLSGLRYFFLRSLRSQLEAEIVAQLQRFSETGLVLDHLNGHLNIHLHPVVLDILLRLSSRFGIKSIRLTCDPFFLNARLAPGNWGYRLSHAIIYRLLSARARPAFRKQGIRHTARVFGLLQNSRVDERFLLRLLEVLPPGVSEIYSHPSLDLFRHEHDALISAKVKKTVAQNSIALLRYQDLS